MKPPRSKPRSAPLTIGGITVAAGESRRIEIPVARLVTQTQLSLPVAVIHGEHPGPRLWVSAAVHGDEINGVEIIRRVLEAVEGKGIRGTLIAVPIVNVFGFITGSRYLPDRRDLNRSFPGSEKGSLAGRLAHLFLTEVVEHCSHGIDLHTGAEHRDNLPQVRGDLSDPETRRCAETFAARVMIHSRVRDGSLREAATRQGCPVLVFEGGEAHRFNEDAIVAGTVGVLRVMTELGMGRFTSLRKVPPSIEASSSTWVRARRSGIFRSLVKPGEWVRRRQRLGVISDAFGDVEVKVLAPVSGVVIGATVRPLVSQGDALMHLAVAQAPS